MRTTSPNPISVAGIVRREITRAGPEFRVSNIRTQTEINEAQTIRERLLAMLALFFAAVGLLLAGIGLYGVLDYSVLQRRRELGIRIAVGAPGRNIARLVTLDVFSMVLLGSVAGAGAGLLLKPYIKSLLYQISFLRHKRFRSSGPDDPLGRFAGGAAGGDSRHPDGCRGNVACRITFFLIDRL